MKIQTCLWRRSIVSRSCGSTGNDGIRIISLRVNCSKFNGVKAVFVMPASHDVYNKRIPEAGLLIEDVDDSPIVALALSVDNEGVWTYNTKHFKQEFFGWRLRVLSTKDVLGLYPLRE